MTRGTNQEPPTIKAVFLHSRRLDFVSELVAIPTSPDRAPAREILAPNNVSGNSPRKGMIAFRIEPLFKQSNRMCIVLHKHI